MRRPQTIAAALQQGLRGKNLYRPPDILARALRTRRTHGAFAHKRANETTRALPGGVSWCSNTLSHFTRSAPDILRMSLTLESDIPFLESVVKRMPGFLYRCKADKEFTMLELTSGFERSCGFPASDILNNSVR